VCVHMNVCECVWGHADVSVSGFVGGHVDVCVWMCVCMCVWDRGCVYACRQRGNK
jgi:hypothetical protein